MSAEFDIGEFDVDADEDGNPLPAADDPPSAPAPAPKVKKPLGRPRADGKPPGSAQQPVVPQGVGQKPREWTHREADLMWAEMCGNEHPKSLGKLSQTVYDIGIAVVPMSGPASSAPLGTFDGSAVAGDERTSPGEALTRYVIDNFHLPIATTPAEYEIRFFWKRSGTLNGRGRMALLGPDRLMALRRAQQMQAAQLQQQQGGVGALPNAGQPMPQVAQGLGFVPAYLQPQQQQQNETIDALRREVATVMGELKGALQARAEAAAAVPPKPEETLEEKIAKSVAAAIATTLPQVLTAMGVHPQPVVPPQVGVGTPLQNIQPAAADSAEATFATMKRVVELISGFEEMKSNVKKVFGVVEEIPVDPTVEVAEEEGEKPEEPTAPFKVMPIPGAFLEGAQINFVYDTPKEEGFAGWLKTMAMANPSLSMAALSKFAGVFEKMVAAGGGPQAVTKALAAAGVASVAGSGETPPTPPSWPTA